MKVQEVILRAMAKKITWWQAAEIAGMSDRQMRRLRWRYENYGYDGLLDRRRGRRARGDVVPLALAEQVLGLYREKYYDLNVRHFHEKLGEQHGITLSYTWVKLALQGAGLVAKARKRGVHRKRRVRRPLHWRAAAYRWQPTSVVPGGRSLVRPDRDPGRRHQRDLLRAVGGRGIHHHGDGRALGSHGAQGPVLRLVLGPGELCFLKPARLGRAARWIGSVSRRWGGRCVIWAYR